MVEVKAKITSKGQITLPAVIRRHLGVSVHDQVAFVVDDKGEVRVRRPRYPDIESLRGMAGTLPRPMSWQEVKQTAREDHLIEKYRPRE